ncbi:MAG: hypothetical protein IJ366_03910 [Clostridia bacterium]|nr:hypothetical protein [Clostridia bacterium]
MSYLSERAEFLLDGVTPAVRLHWPEKKETWLAQRYALFCASGLLASKDEDKIKLAVELIEDCGELPDCSFCPFLSMKILHCHSDLLSEKAKDKLLTYQKTHAFQKMLLPDFDYLGVNDNFPSMASYVALVGGKYFNDERAINIGKERLRDFCETLTRRDMASEYSSPCYIPFSILAMASIVNDVDDEEAKGLALKCEKQLWLDIVNHYHPEFNLSVGPYSRAYAKETLGYPTNTAPLYYLVFGKGDIKDCYARCIDETEEIEAHTCWVISAGEYHCPKEYIDIAVNKEYPFESTMTAEIAPCRYQDSDDIKSLGWDTYRETALAKDRLDEYPGGVTVNTTHIEKDFGMGTALRVFHSGIQSDSLHIMYKKEDKINTVFTKYTVNNKVIGEQNYNEWLECVSMPCMDDEGRKFGLQTNSTSLMIYKPTYFCHNALSSARLQIIFSTKGRTLDRVYFDGKYITEETVSDKIAPFFVEDGGIYAAFIPLEVTDLGRAYGMSFSYVNDFAVFSLCNYVGETASFRKNQMLLASNGFAVTVKSKSDFASFEEFINKYKDYELCDETFACGHTRGSHERKIRFKNADGEFAFALSPMTEGIRYAVAGGKTIV